MDFTKSYNRLISVIQFRKVKPNHPFPSNIQNTVTKQKNVFIPMSNIIRLPLFVPAITFNVDFGTYLSTQHNGNFSRQAHVSPFFKSKTLQLPLLQETKEREKKILKFRSIKFAFYSPGFSCWEIFLVFPFQFLPFFIEMYLRWCT